jgi:hypothetical protein
MLPFLHANGRLVKVSTAQVEMTPVIGTSILLSELNQLIAEQRGVAVDDLHIKPDSHDTTEVASAKELPSETADVGKTTSASVNETAPETFDSPESQAKFYRSQADKLAKQAAEFRRKAEELVPTKRPK